MARRKRIEKRQILPDPLHDSRLVSKFINNLMRSGKRGIAEQIFYGALDIIKDRTGDDGLETFEKAIENTSPVLEVKSRRIGGATYQVPVEVSKSRKQALAMRWLIASAKARGRQTMEDRLASELIAAAQGEGGAVRKKEEVHRMAEANKAFAHFR